MPEGKNITNTLLHALQFLASLLSLDSELLNGRVSVLFNFTISEPNSMPGMKQVLSECVLSG